MVNELPGTVNNKSRLRFYLWVGLAYLLLSLLVNLAHHRETFWARGFDDLWVSILIIALNYFLLEYIGPIILARRIGRSILLLLLQLFLSSCGVFIWRCIGIALHIYTPIDPNTPDKTIFADQFGDTIGSFFFFGIIRHIYYYIMLRRTARQLHMEKQAAELNYLKSQTNPHFLFNTLNNIYSLARDKSDLAPESILRLSQILRYMLYEAGGDYIAIGQELKIMGDYIALEQLRYDETLHVNFNHDIEDMKQALPPLLLIPLVENAFKHGVSETRNRPFVDIHLSVKHRHLSFFVKNSTEEPSDDRPVKENIGLSNLRRQLELLYTDFSLAVQQGSAEFTATLKINLASHV